MRDHSKLTFLAQGIWTIVEYYLFIFSYQNSVCVYVCFPVVTDKCHLVLAAPLGISATPPSVLPHHSYTKPFFHQAIYSTTHPVIRISLSPLVPCPIYMWRGHYQHVFVRAVHLNESQWNFGMIKGFENLRGYICRPFSRVTVAVCVCVCVCLGGVVNLKFFGVHPRHSRHHGSWCMCVHAVIICRHAHGCMLFLCI